MNLLFILMFYFTSSTSLDIDFSKYMIKKVNKNKLDLNITQDDRNITIKFKSKEYIPAGGIWGSDMFTINDNEFLIEGTNFFYWVTENITDKYSLDRFINSISSRTFEHIAPKENFYKKADDLQLGLVIFKIEDFRKLAVEILKNHESSSLNIPSEVYEFEKKIIDMQVIYFVKYNNTANEIPSDLNDYELYILKSSSISDSFEIFALLKRCAFDVIVSATLNFTIFGILILAGRYSLSKYF